MMFAHLGALLLASLAVSADSARDCIDKRSGSIFPRQNSNANGWAGAQFHAWDPCSGKKPGIPISSVDVKFTIPGFLPARWQGSNAITLALAIGDPGVAWPNANNFLWAGVHVSLTNRVFNYYPVWGANTSQINVIGPNDPAHTFVAGDTVDINIYFSPAGGWALVSNMNPAGRAPWSAFQLLNDTTLAINKPSFGEAMIMASLANPEQPSSTAFLPIPIFANVVFYGFAVGYLGIDHIQPPQQMNYFDMRRRAVQRIIVRTDPLWQGDTFAVHYGRIGGGGGIF